MNRSPCYHSAVAITFPTVSVHLKYLLPHCCGNKVSFSFSTHISHCYHIAVVITFLTLSIHLKSVLPQCCVNKVSSPFYTHTRFCYHRDVAITVLTVSIHLKSVLPQCCVNKVSYSFPIHISPCYHSAVAITFLTVSIHLKYVLPQYFVNKVSYSFSRHRSHCYHSAVAITFSYAMFTLGSRRPRFRPPWRKRDGRGATQSGGMDKLGRPWLPWLPCQILKTVKKFATAVTVRIRNLAGRGKTALAQQNVTVRNKRQQNFETVFENHVSGTFLWFW